MLVLLGLGLYMRFTPPVHTQVSARVRSAEQWLDVNGIKVSPLLPGNHKAVVLLFVMTDCPIANGYAPEVNRIMAEYSPRGIVFDIVYVDPHLSAATARQHVHDYGYRCTALLDPRHTLVRWAGATITPEAVVVGADRSILYRGRIDDRVVDFGKMRHRPNRQDLRMTLDAVLRGAPVPMPRTPCVGCFISSEGTRP